MIRARNLTGEQPNPGEPDEIKYCFFLDKDLKNEFKAVCAKQNRSMADVLNHFVRLYVLAPHTFFKEIAQDAPSIAECISSYGDMKRLEKASYIKETRLAELQAGAYPNDIELVLLARVLRKASGALWEPEELMLIRERDFTVEASSNDSARARGTDEIEE